MRSNPIIYQTNITMKTKLLAAMLLLTGLVQGQDEQPKATLGELREQAIKLRNFDGKPPVADVAALVAKIKDATPAPVATGDASTLTVQELGYRDAIEQFSLLMYRRLGYFTASQFAGEHKHFGCAAEFGVRKQRWEESLSHAQQWHDLAPGANDRKALLWKVKAYNKQDVTGEVNAFVAALKADTQAQISREVALDLLAAWCASSPKPYPVEPLQALIDTLAEKQAAVGDKALVRIAGAARKAKAGVNVNQDLMDILSSVNGLIEDPNVLSSVLESFIPANSTNTEVAAFYDKVIQAAEVNPRTVSIIRNLIDQKTKLELSDQ